MIKQVVSKITKITEITEIMVPNLIRLGWKTDSDQEGTTNIMNTINTINIEGVHEGNAGLRTDPQTIVDPQIETKQNLNIRDPTLTNKVNTVKSPTNTTKTKRQRKTPCTRTEDFLW